MVAGNAPINFAPLVRGRHFKLKEGARWKECSTHTTSYQEARKERQRVMQAQREGRFPSEVSDWTLAKAAKEWLVGRARLVAPQTARIDRERLVPLQQILAVTACRRSRLVISAATSCDDWQRSVLAP